MSSFFLSVGRFNDANSLKRRDLVCIKDNIRTLLRLQLFLESELINTIENCFLIVEFLANALKDLGEDSLHAITKLIKISDRLQVTGLDTVRLDERAKSKNSGDKSPKRAKTAPKA